MSLVRTGFTSYLLAILRRGRFKKAKLLEVGSGSKNRRKIGAVPEKRLQSPSFQALHEALVFGLRKTKEGSFRLFRLKPTEAQPTRDACLFFVFAH